jgi:hypothetical protein
MGRDYCCRRNIQSMGVNLNTQLACFTDTCGNLKLRNTPSAGFYLDVNDRSFDDKSTGCGRSTVFPPMQVLPQHPQTFLE